MFLYTMSIFENKTSKEAKQEVRANEFVRTNFFFERFTDFSFPSSLPSDTFLAQVASKFLSIYAIGFVYWPIAQTINFAFVSPRNQVIYVSVASLIWTTFLAIMKVRWS